MSYIWQITELMQSRGAKFWFSDGLPVFNYSRGVNDSSYRLIVEGLGFLDITTLDSGPTPFPLNFNGSVPAIPADHGPGTGTKTFGVINVSLTLPSDGTFFVKAAYSGSQDIFSASGHLKPLPVVSIADIEFIRDMIKKKYVPYQNIPNGPGKAEKQLRKLGSQYFPFSPYSFELAMVIYDWTTASFARMVFNKVFEYTGIPTISLQPFPLDEDSLALMIWKTNWPPYHPSDKDYMNSFMMQPASSLEEVKAQLAFVRDRLHKFSDVENRLLAAACLAMPRTPLKTKRQLFSGQVDIYQFTPDRFGIEFLECPLNSGPVGEQLIHAFDTVMSSYVSQGKTITTKMVWSFTDSVQDAMHYQNGILLIVNPPANDDSWVWESTAYVTPLSDDPAKTEYVFSPGTSFLVQRVEDATVGGKKVTVISLQPVAFTAAAVGEVAVAPLTVVEKAVPNSLEKVESTEGAPEDRAPHKMAGRRYGHVDVADGGFKWI